MIPVLSFEEASKQFNECRMVDTVKDPAAKDRILQQKTFRALLNNPPATFGFYGLATALMNSEILAPRVRELVILRIAWRAKSEIPFVQHRTIARGLKMTDEEILGVRDPDECRAYGDADRAVIAMADELHDQANLSPRTSATLERFFSAAELVELILVAGCWRMGASFINSAEITREPSETGWPEDRSPE